MVTTTVIGAGPNRAGSRVTREQTAGAVVPADIGNACYIGPYRWGPVATGATPGGDDSALIHGSRGDFIKWRGTDLVEHPNPTSVLDHYTENEGAGRVVSLRLTDGDEAQASLELYDRDVEHGWLYETAYTPPNRIMTVSGLYPGKRGGRLAFLAGVGASSFSASGGTFDTAVAGVTDQWLNATLYFSAHTQSYRVSGSDTSGLLTIDVNAGQTAPDSGATWWVILNNVNRKLQSDGLAVRIASSVRKPASEFGFELYADGAGKAAIGLPDSSGDSALDNYLDKVLSGQVKSRAQLLADIEFDDHVPGPSEIRPANWVGMPLPGVSRDLSTLTVKVQTWFWQVTTGASAVYLNPGSAEDDFDGVVYGSAPMRVKAECTFTDATGGCAVVYKLWDGTTIMTLAAEQNGAAVVPGVPFLPQFLVEGLTTTEDDVITVWFDPLPSKLAQKRGILWAHGRDLSGSDDLTKKVRITGNTATVLTLQKDHTLADTVDAALPPVGVAVAGVTYDLSANNDFAYNPDATGLLTLVSALSGAAETAAALAADLNAKETVARAGEERIFFYVDVATGNLAWRGTRSVGGSATILVSDSATTIVGIVTGDATFTGVDGDVMAISYVQDLHGGLDGIANLGSADEYETIAFDLANSPLLQLDQVNLGLLTLATPGENDADVQNAANVFTHAQGWQYVGEIDPTNADEEAAAAAWVRDNIVIGGSATYVPLFDSYGERKRAILAGLSSEYPITGAVMGMMARVARNNGGYHKAPAGDAATINRNFRRLASASEDKPPRWKDDGILNAAGILTVQQQGASIFVYGDEIAMPNFVGLAWLHKERAIRHIARELLFLGRRYTFDVIDQALWARITVDVRKLLRPKFNAGWFKVRPGQGFEDVVSVRVDSTLNPDVVQEAGKVIAVVQIQGIKDTAKLVEFALQPGTVAVIQE